MNNPNPSVNLPPLPIDEDEDLYETKQHVLPPAVRSFNPHSSRSIDPLSYKPIDPEILRRVKQESKRQVIQNVDDWATLFRKSLDSNSFPNRPDEESVWLLLQFFETLYLKDRFHVYDKQQYKDAIRCVKIWCDCLDYYFDSIFPVLEMFVSDPHQLIQDIYTVEPERVVDLLQKISSHFLLDLHSTDEPDDHKISSDQKPRIAKFITQLSEVKREDLLARCRFVLEACKRRFPELKQLIDYIQHPIHAQVSLKATIPAMSEVLTELLSNRNK